MVTWQLTLLVVLGHFLPPATSSEPYLAVIDAGSRHTTIHLFSWNSTCDPHEVASCRIGDGGISQFVDHPDQVGPYLLPCMTEVAAALTPDQLMTTNIAMGATSGMRLVQISDPAAAAAIIAAVEELLMDSVFQYEPGMARIMTGAEEGGYAWITANLLSGALGTGIDGKRTDGALDMGGGSAQVAFECRDNGGVKEDYCSNGEETLMFELYGQEHTVFSTSNECYGLRESMERYLVLLMHNNLVENGDVITKNVKNPCMRGNMSSHPGDNAWLQRMKGNPTFPTKKSEIIFTHCTDVTEPTLAAAIDQLEDDFEFEWVPSYDEAECNEVLGRLLDQTSCQDVFDASSDSCFDLKILGIEQVSSLAEAQGRIDEVCAATKDEMETSCFKVTYIMKMLLEGYGFDETTFPQIDFVQKVEGEEVNR